jgi:hypothetical protein
MAGDWGEGDSSTRSVTAPMVHLQRLCDPIVPPRSHRSKFGRTVQLLVGPASSASPLPPLTPKIPLDHDHQPLYLLVPRSCVTDAGFAHYGSLFLAPDRSHHGPQHALPRTIVRRDASALIGPDSARKFYSQAASAHTASASVERGLYAGFPQKPVICLVFNSRRRGDVALNQSRFVQDHRSDI